MQTGLLRFTIEVDGKGLPVIKDINGKIHTLGATTQEATAKASAGFGGMWKQMALGQAAFGIVMGGFHMIKRGITETFGEALTFQKEFANVTTLIGGPATSATKEMEQAMLGMAGELGSATELTQGLYNALSAGVPAGEAVKFIGESAIFSKAALAGMYESVDVLTTVINAYGLKTSEVTEVSDILFQVIKDGKITGEQLAGSMGKIIPTAAAMGVNLKEVGAAVATMTKGGISADETMTALNQTLLSALSPTQEASEKAKSLGVDLSRAGIEGAGGLQKWLALLKEKLAGNAEAMNILFPNVRALKGALSLAGEQAATYAKEIENMNNATGNSKEAFEKQQATLSAVAEAIKNRLSATIVQVLLPVLEKFAKWLSENKEEIGRVTQKIIDFGAKIGSALGTVIGWLVKSKDALLAAAIAVGTFTAVGKITAWVTAMQGVGSGLMIVVQRAQMLQAVGVHSTAAYMRSINYASGAVNGLSGILGNLPAVGMAAFAGWQIGRLISEALGLDSALQDVFESALDILGLQAKEKAVGSAISEQRGQSIEEIRAIGKELGVATTALSANVLAVYQNKEAFDKLSPNAKAIVTRMGEKAAATAKATEELKKNTKTVGENAGALGGSNDQLTAAQIAAKAKAIADWNAKQATEQWNLELEKSSAIMDALNMNTFGTVAAFDLGTKATEGFTLQLNKNTESQFNLSDAQYYEVKATQEQVVENGKAGRSFEEMRAILDTLNDAFSAIGDAFDSIGLNIDSILSPIQNAVGGLSKMAGGFSKLSEIQKAGKPDLMGTIGAIGSLAGGLGQAVSAVLSLGKALAKLFKGHGVEEAIQRENAWMKLTDEQKKQLVELEKQYGSTHAATSELLDEFIRDADITTDSFDQWANRVHGILSDLDQGKMTLAQTQKQLGDSFDAIISKAKELGTEGSASLINMFEDLEGRGIKVAEVQAYINQQLEAGLGGYKAMKEAVGESTAAQEAFGQLNIKVFEDMIAYEKKVEQNKGLVNAISGATEALIGLSNAQRLTQEQFDQFSTAAQTSFDKLIAGGMNSSEAIKTMGPYLQRLQFLHEQYGYTIDDNTQKILDQAKKEGVVIENKKTEQQQIIGLLEKIAIALGADIPEALDKTSGSATKAFREANKAATAFNSTLDNIGKSRTIKIGATSKNDEVAAATGFTGWVAPRSFTRFVTGEDEAEFVSVTPMSKMRRGMVPVPSLDVMPRESMPAISPITIEDRSVWNISVDPKSGIDQGDLTSALLIAINDNRQAVADKIAKEVARRL